MEWLEQLKGQAPYVVILGAGLAGAIKFALSKDAALTAEKDARIKELLEIVKNSSKD